MQAVFYRVNNWFRFIMSRHNSGVGRLLTFGSPCLKCGVVLLFAICVSSTIHAQEKDGYIFRDSAVMEDIEEVKPLAPDSPGVITNVEESDSEEVAVIPDSVLTSNELRIPADSIRALKSARPFAYAKNLDSMLKSLKKKQEVNYSIESNAPTKIDLFFASGITKAVLWSLAVGMLLFILVKLFLSGGFLQRNSTKSKVQLIEEQEAAVPDVGEYDKLISQALAPKDYRLATRYLYLQSLQYLIDRGVVTYAADKTNYEYLSEMGGHPKREAFAALTLKYEYVWYGGFTIDETAFAGVRQSFTQFNNAL